MVPAKVYGTKNVEQLAPDRSVRFPRQPPERLRQVLNRPMYGKVAHEMGLELGVDGPTGTRPKEL